MNTRWFVAIALALTVLLVSIGCGSDSEPDPTPTEAPPTATPTPEPTPEPASPLVVAQAGSLADFYLADTSTGLDLMSRVSEAEQDCLRRAIGDTVYAAWLGASVVQVLQETGTDGAGSFLGCLTEDNLLLFGLVLIDANAGRGDQEARECRIPIVRANPDMIRIRFAQLRAEMGTIDSDALLDSERAAFDCLPPADQAGVLIRFTRRLDAEDAFTGRDIIELLSTNEAACIRERVGEEQFETLLTATVIEVFGSAAELLDCLTPEGQTAIFAAVTASRVDGLSEEALACITSVVAESPNILALGFGTLDVDRMDESDIAQLGDDASRVFQCLDQEELLRVLTLPPVIEQWDSEPAPASTEATATPAPEPASPLLVAQAGTLTDFYLTDTTTGLDLMSRLSEGEQDCLRRAIGDGVYANFLEASVVQVLQETGTGTGGAGSFLGCLTDDNLLLFGLVLIDVNAERVDPEARECRIPIVRANPDMIHIRFARLRAEMGTIDAEALLDSQRAAFDCLPPADQADVLIRFTTRLDAEDTFTGRDIIELLSADEAACIRESVSEEQFDALLTATAIEVFGPAAELLDCLTVEGQTEIFTAFTASRVDGLSENALACIRSVASGNPDILALGFGTLDVGQMEESDIAQLGDDASRIFYECLDQEELLRVLTLPPIIERW